MADDKKELTQEDMDYAQVRAALKAGGKPPDARGRADVIQLLGRHYAKEHPGEVAMLGGEHGLPFPMAEGAASGFAYPAYGKDENLLNQAYDLDTSSKEKALEKLNKIKKLDSKALASAAIKRRSDVMSPTKDLSTNILADPHEKLLKTTQRMGYVPPDVRGMPQPGLMGAPGQSRFQTNFMQDTNAQAPGQMPMGAPPQPQATQTQPPTAVVQNDDGPGADAQVADISKFLDAHSKMVDAHAKVASLMKKKDNSDG